MVMKTKSIKIIYIPEGTDVILWPGKRLNNS
jgi:hypothetical protein